MTQAADLDIDAVLQDLESDADASRRSAIVAAVRLGERAVRAIPVLQRMAAEEVIPEIRHLARKGLHLLAQEANARAQAQAQAQALTAPGGKSAKITQELAKESIPVVAAKLNSSSPHVRASALRATAIRREKLLLPTLLDRLGADKEPDAELRAIQVRVLAILGGKDQLKGVAAFLDDTDADVRCAAVDVLAQYRDVMAFPFIVRALQDPEPRPQQRAAAALSKVGPLNILKICELMIQSDRAWSRDAAVFCLALTAIPDGVRLLEQSLGDVEESVRKKSRMGLERLSEKGVAAAKEALARSGADPRNPAGDALPASAPVVDARPAPDMASPEATSRRVATKQLVALHGALDESHLPGILRRLELETDVLTLVNLLTAIGRIRSASATGSAGRFLEHPDEAVRAATVDTLALLGSPPALEQVKKLLADVSPVVIGRAVVALKDLPEVDVVAEMTRMASNADVRFRTAAIYVITELGDERLVPLIDKLGRDADPGVAQLASDSSEILAAEVKQKALTKPRQKIAKTGPSGAIPKPPRRTTGTNPTMPPAAQAAAAAPRSSLRTVVIALGAVAVVCAVLAGAMASWPPLVGTALAATGAFVVNHRSKR